jgi:hypothetical protein
MQINPFCGCISRIFLYLALAVPFELAKLPIPSQRVLPDKQLLFRTLRKVMDV